MKGVAVVGILFLVFLFGLIIYDNSTKDERVYNELKSSILEEKTPGVTESKSEAQQEPVKQKEWVKIKTWTSTGMKNTETFTVQNHEWKITWRTSKEAFPGAGILQAFLNTPSGEMKELPINQIGAGSGDTIMRGAGSYYLEVSSANMTWEISVYDFRVQE
jgi:hypothetical protein